MTRPMLRIRGLKLFRNAVGDGPAYALSVPDFSLDHGARIGLVGESGSGKTSFLEVLGLLAWPDHVEAFDFAPERDAGVMDLTATIAARETTLLSRLRAHSIGFVMQDGGLLPYLTVRENAELSLNLSGRAAPQLSISRLGEMMGIGAYLDRYQSVLSGGQRQRAAVLRALAPGVPLLLADEPTAALDPQSGTKVMEAMLATAEAMGSAMIVASHNPKLLEAHGFEILRVNVNETQGRLTAELEAA